MNKTKLDAAETRTVKAFDLEADLQFRSDPPGVAGADIRFAFSLVDPNPLVVDVGCGYGRVIPHLQQIGPFRYIGIDPSVEMLKIGKKEHPEMDFREMHLYELPRQFPGGHFDLAIAITTLAYVTSVRMREALESIRAVLHSNGIGYFTFMDANETFYLANYQPQDSSYKGPVTRLTGWTFERIDPVLKRAGFKSLSVYRYGDSILYAVIARAI